MPDVHVVLSTCPAESAGELARQLVSERLAACCNTVSGLESTYWWEGKITTDRESLLILKTPGDRVEALISRLQALHPYDVPEILALPVATGLDAYMRWVANECAGPSSA